LLIKLAAKFSSDARPDVRRKNSLLFRFTAILSVFTYAAYILLLLTRRSVLFLHDGGELTFFYRVILKEFYNVDVSNDTRSLKTIEK